MRATLLLLTVILALSSHGAVAIMAGAAPDSPAARVDANLVGSAWAGVVSVVVGGSAFSGVVIGPRFILTAAHVVGTATPASISVRFNYSATPQSVPVHAVHLHPGYVGFNNPNLNDDLAILELDTDVPPAVPIYTISSTQVAQGATLTMVGYGGSGLGSLGVSVAASPTIKRVGRNNVDQLLDDDEGLGRKEVFVFDFDGGSAANFMGGTSLGNSVETTFASGDSGSPSFIQSGTGQWLLAGLNTFVVTFPAGPTTPATFGTGGGGQLLAAHTEWIHGVISAAESDIPMLPGWAAILLGGAVLLRGARWLQP